MKGEIGSIPITITTTRAKTITKKENTSSPISRNLILLIWLSSAGSGPVNLFPAETNAKVKRKIRELKIYNFSRSYVHAKFVIIQRVSKLSNLKEALLRLLQDMTLVKNIDLKVCFCSVKNSQSPLVFPNL